MIKEKEEKGPKGMIKEKEEKGLPKGIIKEKEEKGLRGIVHLVGKDIKGELRLSTALQCVKGIGIRLSQILISIISKELGVPEDVKIGTLSEEQTDKIEEIIKDPAKHGIPGYLLNLQKEVESGKDTHLLETDLTFKIRQAIEREKDLYSWKGFRHVYGQKVRGQRTRTAGRKGLTVGVMRAKAKEMIKEKAEKEKEKKK